MRGHYAQVLYFSDCKKSAGDGSSTGGNASGGAAYQTSAQIGAAGGTISDPNGKWTLTIPAGALTSNKDIAVTTNASATGSVPLSYTGKTPILNFSPTGLTFLTPATLKVSYAQGTMIENGIEEKMIKFYQIKDDSTVVAATTTLNASTNEITVQLPHFSSWQGLSNSLGPVANGTVTNPNAVQNAADRLIDYLEALPNDAARNQLFADNQALLGPFLTQLIAVLGADVVSAAFPNADFDGDGTPNNGEGAPAPIVSLVSSGSLFVSNNAGAISSTQFTWRSNTTGTFEIRRNGTSCNDGTVVQSGAVTANADNNYTPINAAALNTGSNEFRICATAASQTGFLVITVVRDEVLPVSSASPAGGTYTTAQNVAMSCLDSGEAKCAQIAYTTNGTDPTFDAAGNVTNGTLVAGMWLTPAMGATTLKVRSRDEAGNVGAPVAYLFSLPVQTYTVGGTVSGLSGTVVLQNNGADDLSLTANGSFTFATTLSAGGAYRVSIKTNPTGQICFFQNASDAGAVLSSNITSVIVNCASSTSTSPAWVHDAYLKASNAEAFDRFGYSVAVSGSILAVGASDEDSNQTTITNADGGASANNSASFSGAVYVFKREASGDWVQDAYLKASNAGGGDNFGNSVAVSGTTIVVGAFYEDSNETTVTNTDGTASTNNSAADAGAVYVFQRENSGDWVQDAYLKASNAESGDNFGQSVAISGSILVVGAGLEDSGQTIITNTDGAAPADNNALSAGAVYVFKREASGNWVQDACLKASNAGAEDQFGTAVAVSGSTVVVGAPNERSNQTSITNTDGVASGNDSASFSGAVYVFKREANGDWVQDAYLKASNSGAGDHFGWAIAVSGSTVVVGALTEASNQTTVTNTDGAASADDSASNAGAVYVFKRETSGDWLQDAYLKAANPGLGDFFGWAVGVSGSTVVVGATLEESDQTSITNVDGTASSNNDAGGAGAVYVFKREASGDWVQDAYLKAPNAGGGDNFSFSLSVSGSTVVVGTYYEASNQTTVTNTDGIASANNSAFEAGAAYVFKLQ